MGFFAERQKLLKRYNPNSTNKLRMLSEVEVDGQQVNDDSSSTDYTEDQNTTNEPAQSDAGNEETPQNDQGADQGTDQGTDQVDQGGDTDDESTDYTAMDDAQGGDEGEEGGDTEIGAGGDEGGGDTGGSSGDGGDAAVDDLKKQEEELLSDLTPEQLDVKHRELKNQYLSMYDIVNSLIERIGDVAVREEDINTVEYISTTLTNLKDMITDYMNSIYKTKSYIENSINYNRFLAVLNGINKILEEMGEKED